MAIQITIPRLGWSMEEGTFSNWLKSAGEQVRAGEPLFSVESDKVTMDVESLDAGILYLPADAPQPGAVVKVGQLIGYLLAEGEAPPGDVPVTPRARRVARELSVDLSNIQGSGKGGRIREQDVRAAANQPGHGAADPRHRIAPHDCGTDDAKPAADSAGHAHPPC